jgi:hypothetical protein
VCSAPDPHDTIPRSLCVLHSAEDDKPRLQRGKVAPELPVPEHIPRPPYAANYSHPPWTDQVMVHNQEGVAKMRESCQLAARVLQHAGTLVKVRRPCRLAVDYNDASADGMLAASQLHSELMPPGWPTTTTIVLHMQPGVTTDEIDQAVHQMIVDNGAYPSPLRYGGSSLLIAPHAHQLHVTNLHAHGVITQRHCSCCNHQHATLIPKLPNTFAICIHRQVPKKRVHLSQRVRVPRHTRLATAAGWRHRQY